MLALIFGHADLNLDPRALAASLLILVGTVDWIVDSFVSLIA
jgi:hypothetical protein